MSILYVYYVHICTWSGKHKRNGGSPFRASQFEGGGKQKKVNKGLRREAELGKTRRRKTIRLLRDRRGPLCLPLFAKALAKNH